MKNKVYEIHFLDHGCYISDCAMGVVSEIEEDIKSNPENYRDEEKDMGVLEEKLINSSLGDELKVGKYTINVIEMTKAELNMLPEFKGW